MRTCLCISLLFMGLIGLSLCETKMTPLLIVDLGLENVPCPDGGSCPDGNTCCSNNEGGYGCCPKPNAVCCTDGKHCCPSGTTCDLPNGTCDKLEEVKVVCPDGQSQCPAKTTCCPIEDKKFGCCPQENAVCCPDKKHCCPAGYKCDVSSGTCSKEEINLSSWW